MENNWGLPRIAGSFDEVAGSLDSMFAFSGGHGRGDDAPNGRPFILNSSTGQPAKKS